MTSDEKMVLDYLEKYPGHFISQMEVCKRAGSRQRFKTQPEWARAILHRLAQQNILDCNEFGHYRIKSKEEAKAEKRKGHRYTVGKRAVEAEDDRPFASILERLGRNVSDDDE